MDRQKSLNALGYNVRVVCGFPGVGKTRARSEKTIDLNLANHPQEDWIGVIRSSMATGKIVMVSSWSNLRRDLRNAGIEYMIVYPSSRLRNAYLERLLTRKRLREKYKRKISSQFDNMLRSCMDDPSPYHIRLESTDENLNDFI